MISTRRTAHRFRHWSTGVGLAGGAAVTAGMIALAIAPSAHADDTTVDVNGWTVQTDGAPSSPATLIDPSDSLGNGTQVTVTLGSVPYALDHESVSTSTVVVALQFRGVVSCVAVGRGACSVGWVIVAAVVGVLPVRCVGDLDALLGAAGFGFQSIGVVRLVGGDQRRLDKASRP
jgi:hypothetical protein